MYRVLAIEDNAGDAELMREAIEEQGLAVELNVVGDLASCRAALDHLRPSLVLLDLRLGPESGHDVLEMLRSDERSEHLPVVVLSSSHREDDVRRAYEAHANAYVRKPFTLVEWVDVVGRIIRFWQSTLLAPPPTEG